MGISTEKQLDFASRGSMFTYANTAVVIPVSLLAITTEMGFSLTQAGSLSLIGSILQLIILLASIPLAASAGKISPLRWGLWFLGIGMLLFTRITGYISAVLVISIIASGQALIEALLTPLVEDIHPADDGTKQLFLHAFWPMGIILGTLVMGEALSRGVGWRTLFLILGILSFAVGTSYPRRSRAKLPRSRGDFSHAGEILSKPLFWIFGMALFFSGAAEGGFTFWTASYIQIEYGTLPRSGALGIASFSLGMASGRLLFSRIAAKTELRRILIFSVLMAFAGAVTLYFVHNLIVLYFLMAFMGLFVAPTWPGLQTYAVRRLGDDPTMVMVFLSCLGILGFSLASFTMGVIADMSSLRMSFLTSPVSLVLLLILLSTEIRIKPGNRKI